MISLVKIKESSIYQSFRKFKVLQFGAKTGIEAAPFGDDSNPVKNMTAVYMETANNGEKVVVGYLNTNRIANIGEKRIYATDTSGNQVAQIYLKNDGTIQLNDGTKSAVRYEDLNTAIQSANVNINAELSKIATAIGTVGGSYVPDPISIDLSSAKSERVSLD